VIASGETHSVREFVEKAFKHLNIMIEWHGEGLDEVGIDAAPGKVLSEVEPKYFRPTEVEILHGDPSKAIRQLGWNPTKTSFDELVKIMVDYDFKHIDSNGFQYEL